jgi:uncharacterized membrane protein YfcA
MTMLFLAAALSVLIGLSLGLLGGGGSMLTVPILIYVLGVETKSAIATSLLVVAVTSAVGVISHARAGRVQLRTGLLFGAAGMAGAYVGGRVAHFLPARLLLLAFAAMMGVTALAMLRGRRRPVDPVRPVAALPVPRVLLQGAAVGAVTGLVGAGGGFLVVPALALLGGLPMAIAVGTSLLVIAMQSLAGFVGYLGHVAIDLRLTGLVGGTAIVGILIGGPLAGRVPQQALRKAFGWFVLAMAIFLLGKQLF